MNGRTLTIFLVEGTIDGLHTAEIDNWIGKVMVAPKSDLPTLLGQPELKGLGVYILVGNDPERLGGKQIYVGQGSIGERLTKHNSDMAKDFWDDKTIAIVANNGVLNTAHCLYLESRLIELAGKAQVTTVVNNQYPSPPTLSAPDKALVENFLAQTQVLLPVLGIDFFVPPVKLLPTSSVLSVPTTASQERSNAIQHLPEASPLFVLITTKGSNTVNAEAQLVSNKFVVRQRAIVSPVAAPTLTAAYADQRTQLRQSAKLADDSTTNRWVLTEDVTFETPSAAASVICGYNMSGPQSWKVKDSQQTYREWLQAQVNQVNAATSAPAPATAPGIISP